MELETCLSAPGDWQRVTIEDVCVKFTSGGTPSRRRPEFYQDGIVPWVKTKELLDVILQDAEEWITEEAIADSSAKRLPRNTVLMAMYGATVGQLGILGREMACNQACAAMIVDDAKCDYRFLYYLLLANRRQIVSMATGAAQQNLSGAQIKGWTIALPEREEQRAIAHILGTLDDKIELNRRRNQTLEAMARALFKDWFVDFGPVRAKMEGREPYLPADLWQLFPDRLDDEGKPEGWRRSTIGSEVTVCGGSTPSTKEPAFWEGGEHHWATPKDLSTLKFPVLLDTIRKITDAGIEKISSGLLPVGTVLLSSRAPIGYLAITEVPTAINQGFIAMKCDGTLPNVFVLLWSRENMEVILGNANGSTFQEISKSNFRPIPVIVPPESILKAFRERTEPLYRHIVENERESRTLAQLRDTLLPKLISGEVRIRKPIVLPGLSHE